MKTEGKTIAKNKLLTLYFADAVGGKVSLERYALAADEVLGLGYFDLCSAVETLSQSGLLEKARALNGEFYKIGELGKNTLGFFKKEIPLSKRQEIDAYIEKNREEIALEARLYYEYLAISESQCRVVMKLLEEGFPVFELSFIVESKEEADRIAKGWRKRAMEIYKTTFALLLKEG